MGQQAPQQQGKDPRIGVVLQDRYRIVRLIGVGGMGAVYEAEHILIKRRVAIKVLHNKYAQDPEMVARFQREAEAATSIGHPNIVEVTDMGRFPDGTHYMVLEFLEGRDLRRDIKQQGPQPIGKLIHIMSQVCDALDAAHAKGIVHRDLKPDNIFLIERRGDTAFAKVLDFGISKVADTGGTDNSLTQTGTALGTPFYMAPEQCQGRKDLDPRADIYSLGVIMFRALTGQYPFDDESYPMLVLKICTEPPPSIRHYRADVPPELEAVIHRMLAKDRERRFRSCAEVRAALQPFAGLNAAPAVVAGAQSTANQGPSVLQAATPQRSSVVSVVPANVEPARSSRTVLIVALVAALGVLLVLGGVAGVVVLGVIDRTAEPADDVEIGAAGEQPAPDDADEPAPEETAPEGTEASDETEAPAETVAAVDDAPPPAEVAPAAPDEVHITIRATPPEARIAIDGVEYPSNPFEADLPRGPHMVRVTADGYEPYEEEVSFVLNNYAHPVELERHRSRPRSGPVAASPRPQPRVYTPPPPRPTGSFRPVGRTPRPTPSRGLAGFPTN